jgi:hypothetical protein
MSASDYLENSLLKLLFNGTAIANIANNATVSPLTSLYWALHTADPADAGSQSTSEASYTSYTRVAVARDSTGHTVTGSSMSPTNNVNFPLATGGSNTETHFDIGVASSGASSILVSGTISPNIVVVSGVTPVLVPSTAVTCD